jgi:segregation and condensation protein B
VGQDAVTNQTEVVRAFERDLVDDDARSANLVAVVEGLLFVADEPVAVGQLAQTVDATIEEVEAALTTLSEQYEGRGIRLQRGGNRVQMVSAPETASYIERFLGLELSSKLSTAALETLTIVAYQQPVTRADIEAIRGVNSDSVLRSLSSKGLIEELGRLDTVGRPIIYGTTFEFLQFFGLDDLDELPDLDLHSQSSDDVRGANHTDSGLQSDRNVAASGSTQQVADDFA